MKRAKLMGTRDKRVGLAAGFEQQDLIASVFAQPIGQGGTGRTGANHNKVNCMLIHALPRSLLLNALAPPHKRRH